MIVHHALPPEVLSPRAIMGADIIRHAADVFGVPPLGILSQQRHRSLSYARFATMSVMRDMTTKSLPEIGKILGNRDHTTILYGVNRSKQLMASDPEYCERYVRLCRRVEAGQ